MSEWTVRINGVDQVSVKPGNSLEIGRKPLRPLASDGNARLDVADQTKSMSKRHALLTVKENGSASIRDLGSTNGSYVVRDNGDLLRLPPNADFLLPASPMRMQFGDVPADFIRIDDTVDSDDSQPVPDLFGYAPSDVPQEPDAADMSVDDILDLRAGEPTAIFSAASVKHKVDELELGSLNIVQLDRKTEEPALPRDLFADAEAQQQKDEEQNKAKAAMEAVALPEQPQHTSHPQTTLRPGVRISGLVPVDAIAHPVRPVHAEQPVVAAASPSESQTATEPSAQQAAEQTAAVNEPVSETPQASEAQQVSETQPDAAVPEAVSPQADVAQGETNADTQAAEAQDTEATVETTQAEETVASATSSAEEQSAEESNAEASSDAATEEPTHTEPQPQAESPAETPQSLVFVPMEEQSGANEPVQESAADGASAGAAVSQDSADYADATGTYTPAFEPGSVFDRVAKGELKAQEPVVEVDGLNSNDAKTTQDFSLQFEIARHTELLVFLAMNPYLYDDMYAWLAARGEADIDEALAHNKGYQEYREAVGK